MNFAPLTPYADGAKAMRIGPQSRTVPSIAIDYIGDGPMVIFLHGIGGDRSTWAHQLVAFAKAGYCAVAWDARGYGGSDDYDGPLSFTDIADDLARVIDAFAVNKAHIVGTSMGGRISLEFFANYPDRLATLTLAGVHASFGHFPPEKQQAFIAARSKPLIEDGLEPADIAPGAISRLAGPNVSDDARSRAIEAASRLHKHTYIKTVEATTQFDREHVLGEIDVPTLVIGGEFDPLTPPDMTRKVAANINGAEYHMIYDVGHLVNLENPVEFNRLLDQFLARFRDRANVAADPQILAG